MTGEEKTTREFLRDICPIMSKRRARHPLDPEPMGESVCIRKRCAWWVDDWKLGQPHDMIGLSGRCGVNKP